MAEIDRLVVVWDARFDAMDQKLNKVIRSNYAAADKVEKRWKATNDNFAKGALGGALDGLASRAPGAAAGLSKLGTAGLAAAAGIGALTAALAATRQALEFADEIGDSAQKIGISTDTLQEFRYAIRQVGGEAEDADEALSKFTQTFGRAASPLATSKNLKPFEAIGLDPQKLGTVDTALRTVLDTLSRIEDEAERQAFAKALGLEKFIPLAREGVVRIDELRAAARRVGYVMDAELIAKAGEANDRLEDLEQVLRVQVASALVTLAPHILAVAEAFTKIATEVRGAIDWLNKFDQSISGGKSPQQAASDAGFAVRRFFGINDPVKGPSDAAGDLTGLSVQSIQDYLNRNRKPLKPSLPDSPDKAGRKPRDNTANAVAQVEQAMLDASREALGALQDLTQDTEARARIQAEILKLETKSKLISIEREKAQINADEGILPAKKKQLTEDLDRVAVQVRINALLQQTAADQETQNKLQDELLENQRGIAAYYDEIAQINASLAGTARERRRIELKALAQRQEDERTDLLARQERARQGVFGDRLAALQNDQAAEREAQDSLFGSQRSALLANTRGPAEQFVFDNTDAARAAERFEAIAVNAFDSLSDGLAQAIVNAENLGDVAKNVFRQMIADLLAAQLKKSIASTLALFIPGFAGGTNFAPGGWAMVGEQGKELVHLPRGSQVIPHDKTMAALSGFRAPRSSTNVVQNYDLRGAMVDRDVFAEMQRIARQEAATAGRKATAEAVSIANKSAPGRLRSYDLLGS